MRISYAKYTNVCDRPVNEDYLLASDLGNRQFFAVADGLGGHGLGDVASSTACLVAERAFRNIDRLDNSMFDKLFNMAHEALIRRQDKEGTPGKMKTTFNLLCLDESTVYWSHIGDSRTYYFKDGNLIKRTVDHSVPQLLASTGQIEETDIRFHEDRNRLLKVLGAREVTPAFECEEPIKLEGNQQFLLCSDGFWERISEEQMLLCLEEATEPTIWLDNMVELAMRNRRNEKGDNCTALAVWIDK